MVAQALHSARTCGVFVTFVHGVRGAGSTGIAISFNRQLTWFSLWIS
jgi:hypothetical protein